MRGGVKVNKTYILPIEQQQLAKKLSRKSGRIYSKVVSTIFKLKESKNIWLSKNNMEKLIKLYAKKFGLHSQTKQGIVQQYYNNLNSFFNAKKTQKDANPPYKTKKYNKVIYKKSAIKLKGNAVLRLSNGRKGKVIKVKVPGLTKKPKYAELIYHHNDNKYKLHIIVDIENKKVDYDTNNILAIDLGQVHPMVTYNNQTKETVIYNGGKLNSFIRFRNKELAELQKKMSRCKKYSNRWKKLNRAKKKLLSKSKNKFMDVLKKYTSHLISFCLKREVSTIVIGDIKGIRENINFGTKDNQKMHQWVFRQLTDILEYKAKSVGIKVEFIDESYTSQTCPKCGYKHKPQDRNFNCPNCNASFHRDFVGAYNIYKKYIRGNLNKSSVLEGVLTSPYGVRYNSNSISCSINWNTSPFRQGISA